MSIKEHINNYYETMVADALAVQLKGTNLDIEERADIACVALNHLPPRYFRHQIDMAFYLSGTEHEEMNAKVHKVVAEAIAYVRHSHRDDHS
ncbi:MAG: competence protein ComFB [Motiliproteus sp.]|jgi:competence protein ComFB